MDRPAMEIPALTPASEIKAAASNVFQGQNEEYGPQQAFDNDPQTRWATDSSTKRCWIAADLGKATTVEGVRVQQEASYADRITKFEFQYRDGGEWKTIFSGTKISAKFQKKFEPVTAREFRLNILDATEGPTINEIELIGN